MSRLLTVCAALAIVACGTKQDTAANNRDTMTRRQKDSVLAQSGLPGAKGVGMALKVADSLKAKQARLDTIKP